MRTKVHTYVVAAVMAAAIGAAAYGQNGPRAATGGQPPVRPAVGKVNVNTATETQLMLLPGIGARTASNIVEYRDGVDDGKPKPFKTLDDLLAVKGIGPKKLVTLAPYVVFTGPTTLTSKVKSPARPRKP
jgi:competence protein ComEA